MARKLRTQKGKVAYARRKVIVEPVFGQMKTTQGAGRLLLRGHDHARSKWRLLVACHNLRKLFFYTHGSAAGPPGEAAPAGPGAVSAPSPTGECGIASPPTRQRIKTRGPLTSTSLALDPRNPLPTHTPRSLTRLDWGTPHTPLTEGQKCRGADRARPCLCGSAASPGWHP